MYHLIAGNNKYVAKEAEPPKAESKDGLDIPSVTSSKAVFAEIASFTSTDPEDAEFAKKLKIGSKVLLYSPETVSIGGTQFFVGDINTILMIIE